MKSFQVSLPRRRLGFRPSPGTWTACGPPAKWEPRCREASPRRGSLGARTFVLALPPSIIPSPRSIKSFQPATATWKICAPRAAPAMAVHWRSQSRSPPTILTPLSLTLGNLAAWKRSPKPARISPSNWLLPQEVSPRLKPIFLVFRNYSANAKVNSGTRSPWRRTLPKPTKPLLKPNAKIRA